MSNLAVKLQAAAMLAQELHISLEEAKEILDKMANEGSYEIDMSDEIAIEEMSEASRG